MARDVNEIYRKMDELVDSNSTYLFSCADDEDDFESFEGIPIDVGSEMFVKITKDIGVLKTGETVGITPTEFCFMSIKKKE